MVFAGINYLAVLLAAICGFLVGAVWYTVLCKRWMAAAGLTETDVRDGGGKPSPRPFIVAAIAQLVMAFMLAGVVGHLGDATVTPRNGIISGLFIWIGFVVTTMAVNHAFQKKGVALTVIDGGYWLAVLVIQGAVIGLMGV